MPVAVRLLVVSGDALVRLRREGRGRATLESGNVDAGHLERRDVEFGAAERGILVARRNEQQVLAGWLESGLVIIGGRIADECRLAGLEAEKPDARLLVGTCDAVREPAAVR